MAVKYITVAVPATTAGATTNVKPTTFDDRLSRRLTGVYCTNQTRLAQTQLDVAGTVVANIDNAAFSSTQGPLLVDATFPVGVQLSVSLVNGSAGTIAGATDDWVLRYEV